MSTVWWRLWKWIVHLVTRQCELERLCRKGENDSPIAVYHRLETSIWASRQLQHLHAALRSDSSDPHTLTQSVVAAKHIARTAESVVKVYRPIELCITNIIDLNKLVALLAQSKQPYNSENSAHEAMLESLWTALKADVPRPDRITKLWGQIGFQGTDPATDFRGLGVLGLQNLLHFANHYPVHAQRVLLNTQQASWFSFAITGINITGALCNLIEQRQLNDYFYTRGCTMMAFNRLYAYMFVRLDEEWTRQAPKDVMAFGAIFKTFLHDIARESAVGYLALQELN